MWYCVTLPTEDGWSFRTFGAASKTGALPVEPRCVHGLVFLWLWSQGGKRLHGLASGLNGPRELSAGCNV